MIDPIITVDELLAISGAAVPVDVRWYLGEPDRGPRVYEEGHIPDAVFMDLDRDLSAPTGPGRHPLPTRQEFASRLGSFGLGDGDLIVAYDDRGGAVAARLWWMLRDIGHHGVRVLDGGIDVWLNGGHPMESDVPRRRPSTMTVRTGTTRQENRFTLRSRLGDVTLLDGRAGERYRGEEEPVDPVAGHIPTATSAPVTANLDGDGLLLDAAALRSRFHRLGVTTDRDTVVYCGSGVTACHNALAMFRAGLPEPILYPGSWSDWSSSGEEVATGGD